MDLILVVQEETGRDDLAIVVGAPAPQEVPREEAFHDQPEESLRLPTRASMPAQRLLEHVIEEAGVFHVYGRDAQPPCLPNVVPTVRFEAGPQRVGARC